MTSKPTNPVDLWRQLLNTTDVPHVVAVDAAAALATFDRASTLAAERERAFLKCLAELRSAERDQPANLHTQLSTGKRTTLDAEVDRYTAHQAATNHADLCQRIARRAAAQASGIVADIARLHRDELIAWVAHKRCTNVHACGHADPITPALDALWAALGVLLYPLPAELELRPDAVRLPLVFDLRWSRAERSALAWCWQQIDAGEFCWAQPVQARHKRNADAPADRLRFLRVPAELPRVL
jgi:hypothetical protein